MHDPEAARAEMQALLADKGAPDEDLLPEIGGRRLEASEVIRLLSGHLTDRRRARIANVVAGRTKRLVPVVEGLVNTGNVSAVMRSAEALGCQALHVVEGAGEQRFKRSKRTSQGAEKWLDLTRWSGPDACAAHFRTHGVQLVATALTDEAVPIGEIDFRRPTALVFGNEEGGVSEAMLAAVDRVCIVPLPGFTESFNVSVAAAVALHHARRAQREDGGGPLTGDLNAAERERLTARFYLRSVTKAEAILRRKLVGRGS
jgi:tRNA (guanosine-2'-O-)-methyltransferase